MPPAPLLSLLAPQGAHRRTLVMGILNATPDSFSDGGLYADPARAIEHALALVHEGADLIDVGGESTRPGHSPVPLDEELRRVCPVIERLAAECPVPISIDTTKSEVARQAIMLGAQVINDQHGLQGDPAMASVAAACGVPVIAMHDRHVPPGDDVMSHVIAFLRRTLDIADASGPGRDHVIVDPGFGFGKTPAQNLEVLRRLGELQVLERPILIGTSRKSMIGHVLSVTLPSDRTEGTAATVALGIAFGASIVRVHDVRAMVRVARMADAVVHPSAVDAVTQGAAAAATP